MRALHLSDLHVAACALRGLAPDQQAAQMQEALERADIADRYRKRLRRAHPLYGSGTLSGTFGPVKVPDHCDLAYCEALLNVAKAVCAEKGSIPPE